MREVTQILSGEEYLHIYGHIWLLIEYGRGKAFMHDFMTVDFDATDGCAQVKDIADFYSEKIAKSKRVTLFFNSALWDALYEYRDQQWHLISNGKGFA